MKRIIGLFLILCLVFSFVAEAMAAPKWEIKQQTTIKTTKKSITISVKMKKGNPKYQWVFVNPEDPDDQVTGKNLSKDPRFKGIKVTGYTKNKIVLQKVPEALHGWYVHCHLYSNAYKMDTDPIAVQVYGLDPAPEPPKPAAAEEGNPETPAETKEEKPAEEPKKDESASATAETETTAENEPAEPVSSDFSVTANGNYLVKIDSLGKPENSEPVSSLTFTGSGNVAVRSEEVMKSWTVNGVRFEPEGELYGFNIFNLSSDTSISVKSAVKTAASAKVDESVTCNITCQGCSFTYMPKGLKSVKEGVVPSGAVIYVFADSRDAAANGYTVNGEVQGIGSSSIQLTVTGDTEIVVK